MNYTESYQLCHDHAGEREANARAEAVNNADSDAHKLAARCLADSGWLSAAMADSELIAATDAHGLLMTDPCEYGLNVKRTLEAFAYRRAWDYLAADPRNSWCDQVASQRQGINHSWTEMLV